MQNQEISVGAFLYKIENNEILFLLVYSKRNGEWGFPKGHVNEGETEEETAKREIKEETGITDIELKKGFRCIDTYKIKGTLEFTKNRIIDKIVVYYIAKTCSDFVGCCDEEISTGKWLDFKQAISCLKYPNQKNLLEKAYKFIKEEKQ
jgi:8-oxo-dGTP pyrophosphatase MutT (NUDIX family)